MPAMKNSLNVYHAIVAGDMSSSITSPVTNIQFHDNPSIQLNFTGTPTGTFAVQVSNDYKQDGFGNVVTAGNWVSLPLSSVPAASGSADQIYINITQRSGPWIRVVYTATSGSGALDMYLTAKAI